MKTPEEEKSLSSRSSINPLLFPSPQIDRMQSSNSFSICPCRAASVAESENGICRAPMLKEVRHREQHSGGTLASYA